MGTSNPYPYLTLFRLRNVTPPLSQKLLATLGMRNDQALKDELLSYVLPASQMETFKLVYGHAGWFPQRGIPFPSVLLFEPDPPTLALYSQENERRVHASNIEQTLRGLGITNVTHAAIGREHFPAPSYTMEIFLGGVRMRSTTFPEILWGNLIRLLPGLPATVIFNLIRGGIRFNEVFYGFLIWAVLVLFVSGYELKRRPYAAETR